MKKQDKNGGGGGSRTVVQSIFPNYINIVFSGARNLPDSPSRKLLASAIRKRVRLPI
jgi:hypothetical protein